MKSKTNNLHNLTLIIPSLFFVIATILNYYMRQGLFILGVNLVGRMQNSSGPLLNFIENIFSFIGNIMIFIILGAQYFYIKQKIRIIVTLIYVMVGLYFMVVLKQAFQQSRPFWYSPDIKILEWFCPTDFGNPSGHCFAFFAIYEPLISDFWGTGKNKILVWIWLIIGILVAISRMYLGAHSLDQVIYGSLIGLSFLIIYKFWIQALLYRALTDILNKKNIKLYVIINSAMWILFLIIPLVSYYSNLAQRPVNEEIVLSINEKCGLNKSNQHYQRAMLNSAISAYLAFGIVFGFLFLKNENGEDSSFMGGVWAYKSTRSIIVYLVALIIVVGVPTIILVILLPSLLNNATLGYILKVLGATWAGFGLIYPMSLVQKKLNLIRLNPNDQTQ